MTDATAKTIDETPSGSLGLLTERLRAWKDWPQLQQRLQAAEQVSVSRVMGASGAWLCAGLANDTAAPLLVVCHEQDQIDLWCDDLAMFGARATFRLPAWESSRSERSPLDEIFAQRLTTLRLLGDGNLPAGSIVVTSASSLLQPVPAPNELLEARLNLRLGDQIAPEDVIKWLTSHGFHPTPAVALPGEFSVRGGIVDVFGFDADQPVRLEWFDIELESLRVFDVVNQRSLSKIEALSLATWDESLSEQSSVLDYFPKESWVYAEDLLGMIEKWNRLTQQPGSDQPWLTPPELQKRLAERGLVDAVELGRSNAVALPLESVERFSGEVGRVRDELDSAAADSQIYITVETHAERQRLNELFAETDAASDGRLQFVVGRLSGGFRCQIGSWLALSSAEVFQRAQLRRPMRRHQSKPLENFLELNQGQLVVHLSHGIARYHGLEMLEKDGNRSEHLVLEFRGGTRIYVPASQIDLVQKYIGGSKRTPPLSVIGGRQWGRQKEAAAAAVEDLAAEMLVLQAQRKSRPGITFDPDSQWQREFDASFPYHETDDQFEAIDHIKADMETARPMDRLLCGDVGFGKTEVAMRGAFKAIESGYQVAILVPTTILAEQHYQTFRQRMAEFPIDVARLSRFCSTQETREILHGLQKGRIDVVIGTHRLASQDVKFHNLGLVVIDEEQRFGVEVKERLKKLRSTVDVLTMTATPIPRTLHMALVGVRDISNLHTPPEDRIAIETRAMGFDESVIRHAVMRELNRDGQVFFIHNRIEDIENLAQRIQKIVPEASIQIGHGRLPEHELERVMVDFVEHRFDILLATTIVESGLDIPNANTVFIDHADMYGLADLHQLRGRVGRYKHRAYCYLMVDPTKYLTPNAARRLRAIEEFSELGAGFQLAMRDLEIRGAGNLLGTQQSGHIAAVGYELYCQMLETAVRKQKQQPPPQRLGVDIQLPGDAFLPEDYVSDLRTKIELYRRIGNLQSDDAIQALRIELRDRFGEIHGPVERLLMLAELRIDAAIWQIEAIWREGDYLGMRYSNRSRIETLVKQSGRKLRIVDSRAIYATIPVKFKQPDQLLNWTKSLLQMG